MNRTPDWYQFAACARNETDLFFPVGTKAAEGAAPTLYDLKVAEAKQFCQGCPVIDDCLREAVRKGYDFGVWGGTSEEFRRHLRKPPKPVERSRKEPRERAQCGSERGRATHIRKGERPCDDCRIASNRARARRAAAS